MFRRLANLPLKVAHKVARVIQEQDKPLQEAARAREAQAPPAEKLRRGFDPSDLADVEDARLWIDRAAVPASACWVDLRPDPSRGPAAPAGAVAMTLDELSVRLAELPTEQKLVLFDASGSPEALDGARFLLARGFIDVNVLRGGLGGT